MIQASAAYLQANLDNQKEPVFIVVIEGYARAFSTRDIGGTIAQSLQLEIPGTAGPWEVTSSLNQAYNYGAVKGSSSIHDWSPPIVYPRFFSAGDVLTIPPPGGLVDSSGGQLPPAGFSPIFPAWTYVGGLPFFNPESSAGTLCGAWTDLNGRVIQPVWIAANGFILKPGGGDGGTCPAGASQFQIGINDDIYSDNTGSDTINLGSITSEIVDWLLIPQDMSIAVNDLDGGADHQGLIFNVQDHERLITADMPGFAFEGKKITLLQGFIGMDVSDYVTLFTGIIDTVICDNSNLEYQFSCIDAIQNQLQKNIWRYADDGFETSDGHVRTLVGHPLDLLVKALQNDVGLPASLINIAKIENFRDTVYNGMRFFFTVKSPPAAKDWIQSEICKPLGAYLWTNSVGQVDVNFFYPLSLVPVAEITSDTLTDVPLEEEADIVNQDQTRFDFSEGDDNALSDTTTVDGDSYGRYGPAPLLTIDSRGMRAGFQGFYHAHLIARLIFLRYSAKNAKFEDSSSMTNTWNPGVLLEPGDLVSLTCDLIPDRENGVMGITEKLFEVLDRTYHFDSLTVGMTLLRIRFPSFKQFFVAPSSQADYESSSADDKAKYVFMASDDDTYSGGDAANTLT